MRLRVNSCWCNSLRTGGLVFGWLGFAASVLSLVLTFITLILVVYVDVHEKRNSFEGQELQVSASNLCASFVMQLINAVISVLLIAGIFKNKPKLLMPWLILQAIGIIILCVAGVVGLIAGSYIAYVNTKSLGIALVVFVMVSLILLSMFAFSAWCWVVVYSLYHEMRDKDNKPLPSEVHLPNIENGMNEPYQKFNN